MGSNEENIVDNKPIVTYAGDTGLLTSLEASLVTSIPLDSSEWRRSYGRAVKAVFVEASFIPFDKENLFSKSKNISIISQPILHTYWTECNDVDTYKSTVRDDIEQWLKTLAMHNINDWMIVIVENFDIKKSNKLLPRTTVLDKVRSDFATKSGDRCLSVINPLKSETRSAESWRGLLIRIRHLMLTSYNRNILKFEEYVRTQRESRNDQGWNFCQYFLLQEELAFVLEMLGLYDEALVQYDELDALFTQFVYNSNVTDSPKWLTSFQRPLESWRGIRLSEKVCREQRELLKNCEASLLEFRSYLFQRQCALLLLMCKPWEIAQRSLPFLHNCMRELDILELSKGAPDGAAACWVFLCCLEVLHTCKRFTDSNQVEQYSLYTASLWAYARDKLKYLGRLCGLMPGCLPTSFQLHAVVGLSAGMGDSPGTSGAPSPTDKLKEALSSTEAFQKHYLELAELAMGTYKHIGRIRSARMIGRDLAQFYTELGETNKAVAFLSDALRSYEEENWRSQIVQTQLELASCYKKMGDIDRYIKVSAAIASAVELETLVRHFYFDEMMKSIKTRKLNDQPLETQLKDCFKILAIEVLLPNKVIIQDNIVSVELTIDCRLPKEILCSKAMISLELLNTTNNKKSQTSNNNIKIDLDHSSRVSSITSADMHLPNPLLSVLNMHSQLDHRQDGALGCASVTCNSPRLLKRSNSTKSRKSSNSSRQDFTLHVTTENSILLRQGVNKITLQTKATRVGVFKLGQISIVTASLDFLSNIIKPCVYFEVVTESAVAILNKGDEDLLAGLVQTMILTVKSGSFRIADNSYITMKTTTGLTVQYADSSEPLSRELRVILPISEPFKSVSIGLKVLAELPPKKDNKPIKHKVTMHCPWSRDEVSVPLHFPPPLLSLCQLHTSHSRKFLQVSVRGLNVQHVALKEPRLLCDMEGMVVVDFNPNPNQVLVITNGITASYMWELQIEPLQDHKPVLKTNFSVLYSPIIETDTLEIQPDFTLYKCPFEIMDYSTLFVVRCKVEPCVGSEFCRAGSMCHLLLYVKKVQSTEYCSVMYEVLADQTMWAVCGRTAGVITVDSCLEQSVKLDVMPLTAGFLPLPHIRLSKYIPADQKNIEKESRKPELGITSNTHPKLELFSPGQVYNSSKAQQVHVLANNTDIN